MIYNEIILAKGEALSVSGLLKWALLIKKEILNYNEIILAKGEALSVSGLLKWALLIKKEILNYNEIILAKGEALVRGIFNGLCSLKRRY